MDNSNAGHHLSSEQAALAANAALKDLYAKFWPNLAPLLAQLYGSDQGYSSPLLISALTEYFDASRRIMIVGQQTNGWDDKDRCLDFRVEYTRLTDSYRQFLSGTTWLHVPFWRIAMQFASYMDVGQRSSICWSNLCKVDCAGKRPIQIERSLHESFPVLLHEIQIMRPEIVIFFTGPNYLHKLHEEIGSDIERQMPVGGYSERELVRVWLKSLPDCLAYRTYHPGYLTKARKQQHREIINTIVQSLKTETPK